jgi:hypothetical protein
MPAVGAEVLLYFYGIPAEQRQPVLAEKRHLHCRPDALFRSGLSGNSGAWRSRIVQLGVWVSLSKNAFA